MRKRFDSLIGNFYVSNRHNRQHISVNETDGNFFFQALPRMVSQASNLALNVTVAQGLKSGGTVSLAKRANHAKGIAQHVDLLIGVQVSSLVKIRAASS